MSPPLTQVEQILPTLSAAEKAQVLQWVARDLGGASPGVESRPGVCGGEPRVVRTRIPIWLLEKMRRSGLSEAAILGNYSTLRAEDLANAWSYVRNHTLEIEQQMRENEEA